MHKLKLKKIRAVYNEPNKLKYNIKSVSSYLSKNFILFIKSPLIFELILVKNALNLFIFSYFSFDHL